MRISIPYGKAQKYFEVEDARVQGILRAKDCPRSPILEADIVRASLSNPIGSQPLRELVRGRRRITVITSDHTRPLPSRVTMPILLEEIRAGNPEAEITILIATGMHRSSTADEISSRFGERIAAEERIVVHDAYDEAGLVSLGKTPSGLDVAINRLAADCDLLVAEGFIEPHFFAGFSGGRKAVMPGVAGCRTVLGNHCAERIADRGARAGVLDGNPIHEEMLAAARMANLAFILNVALDSDKRIVASFAGDLDAAHRKGCDFCLGLAGARALPADIVVTGNGGYPLDQNIYQTVKCMTTAAATASPGGVIVVAAECIDGHGGEAFYDTFAGNPSPDGVLREILARGRGETIADQWQTQIFVQILAKHRVVMVTSLDPEMIEHMGMTPADSIGEALEVAETLLENSKTKPSITVVPDGVSVIVQV